MEQYEAGVADSLLSDTVLYKMQILYNSENQ